jgi:arsenate reductase
MDSTDNPVCKIFFSLLADPITTYSKTIDDPFNPHENFIAITTCSEADQNCPIIDGASARYSMIYKDPKYADNTSEEAVVYDNTSKLIATELKYIFEKVKTNL